MGLLGDIGFGIGSPGASIGKNFSGICPAKNNESWSSNFSPGASADFGVVLISFCVISRGLCPVRLNSPRKFALGLSDTVRIPLVEVLVVFPEPPG